MSWLSTTHAEPYPTRLTCQRANCGSFRTTAAVLSDAPESAKDNFRRWICSNGHENRVEMDGADLLHLTNIGINDVRRAQAGQPMEPICDIEGCQFIGFPMDRGRHKHPVTV